MLRRSFNKLLCVFPFIGVSLAKAKAKEPKIVSFNIETTFELQQVFSCGQIELMEYFPKPDIFITLVYDNGKTEKYTTNKRTWTKGKFHVKSSPGHFCGTDMSNRTGLRIYYHADIEKVVTDTIDIIITTKDYKIKVLDCKAVKTGLMSKDKAENIIKEGPKA